MVLEELKALGRRLREDDELVRTREREKAKEAERRRYVDMSARGMRGVVELLGNDVAATLGVWRPLYRTAVAAAIGTPTDPNDPRYPGDREGEEGDLIWYDDAKEVWYRPRYSNGSARLNDREHFARLLARSTSDVATSV